MTQRNKSPQDKLSLLDDKKLFGPSHGCMSCIRFYYREQDSKLIEKQVKIGAKFVTVDSSL